MQPLLVTAALILKDNHILLLKRGKEPHKNTWGLPGGIGGFEKTTNPDKAICYEIQGDIDATFKGEFYKQHYVKENNTLTLFYKGTIIEKEFTPTCHNVLEAKYFLLEETKKMDLAFDHKYIIQQYLQNK